MKTEVVGTYSQRGYLLSVEEVTNYDEWPCTECRLCFEPSKYTIIVLNPERFSYPANTCYLCLAHTKNLLERQDCKKLE